MKKNIQHDIMPVQPYIVIHSDNYQEVVENDHGISHFYEFTVRKEIQNQLQAVPDGSVDLLFSIGKKATHTYISGTVLKVKEWPLMEGQVYFGIRFQPGKCILPNDLSIQEIVDEDLEIDGDCFGHNLSEQISKGSGIHERSHIFMKKYLKKNRKHEESGTIRQLERYIRGRIYECRGNITINALAEETGYSATYIRRVFEQIHGISPKVFEKFIRFQNLLIQMSDKTKNCRLEEVSLDCGYYDQSHMMKDFKSFAGMTPEKYLRMIHDTKS